MNTIDEYLRQFDQSLLRSLAKLPSVGATGLLINDPGNAAVEVPGSGFPVGAATSMSEHLQISLPEPTANGTLSLLLDVEWSDDRIGFRHRARFGREDAINCQLWIGIKFSQEPTRWFDVGAISSESREFTVPRSHLRASPTAAAFALQAHLETIG